MPPPGAKIRVSDRCKAQIFKFENLAQISGTGNLAFPDRKKFFPKKFSKKKKKKFPKFFFRPKFSVLKTENLDRPGVDFDPLDTEIFLCRAVFRKSKNPIFTRVFRSGPDPRPRPEKFFRKFFFRKIFEKIFSKFLKKFFRKFFEKIFQKSRSGAGFLAGRGFWSKNGNF